VSEFAGRVSQRLLSRSNTMHRRVPPYQVMQCRITLVRADARKREWFACSGVGVRAASRAPLNKALERMYPVPQLADQILREWVGEVASFLGRSSEELLSYGLAAADFPSDHDLRITLMDGSVVRFRYAFAIESETKRAIAVFTEHCGYHVFPHHEAVISRVPPNGEENAF
jgi:hypothetical protein